jgi:hypothetical protein
MPVGDVRALLTAERADALSAMSSSQLSEERAKAQKYYQGDMTEDMAAAEGRSSAVSTDVSDTIEGLMPQLMDIFAGSDEVVRFDPVGPEDVAAAEQETDYISHVFLQQNPGFMVLYSMIKDALLSKTGIVKVWWDKGEEVDRETYLDLDEASYTMLVADPEVEVVEHTERSGTPEGLGGAGGSYRGAGATLSEIVATGNGSGEGLGGTDGVGQSPIASHDVTVETKRKWERACVEAVAPEEFGIGRNDRTIKDAGYSFHEVVKRRSKLIADGYDQDQINAIPPYTGLTNIETQARDTVEERTGSAGGGANKANELIKIVEHYVRMDYEGNNKPALYRVVTGGEGDAEILRQNGEEVIVREDMVPFAAITPVPVTHRFFGRSVADLVMDIQRIKTALTRGMLDNLYAHNNPRPEVAEALAGDMTLDDLAVMSHGRPIRTNQPGAITWQVIPDITGSIFPALQYLDATREWRTGVSRQGQGVDPEALQNQVATIANQMEEASQAKVKLIARIFAETGIKDLFMLLHGVIRKNGTQAQTVRLRNQWVQVDPRDWKKRNDMTINVGLGTGNKSQQLAGLQLLIAAQREAVAVGMTTPRRLYNSASRLSNVLGYKNPDEFFKNPATPPEQDDQPIQPSPDPKVAQAQQKLELDKAKAGADVQLDQQRGAADVQLAQQKLQAETAAKMRQLQAETALKIEQMNREFALEMEQMEREHELRRQEIRLNAVVKESIGHAQASAKLDGVRFGGNVG